MNVKPHIQRSRAELGRDAAYATDVAVHLHEQAAKACPGFEAGDDPFFCAHCEGMKDEHRPSRRSGEVRVTVRCGHCGNQGVKVHADVNGVIACDLCDGDPKTVRP